MKPAPALVVLVLAAACSQSTGNDTRGISKPACLSTPTPIAQASLPATFPAPVAATYTFSTKQGPTQVVTGYTSKDLDDAYEAYKTALSSGGYAVTKSEKETSDAEVNFEGNGSTGQVALTVECEGRTNIKITIRPL